MRTYFFLLALLSATVATAGELTGPGKEALANHLALLEKHIATLEEANKKIGVKQEDRDRRILEIVYFRRFVTGLKSKRITAVDFGDYFLLRRGRDHRILKGDVFFVANAQRHGDSTSTINFKDKHGSTHPVQSARLGIDLDKYASTATIRINRVFYITGSDGGLIFAEPVDE